jgi:Redoxin
VNSINKVFLLPAFILAAFLTTGCVSEKEANSKLEKDSQKVELVIQTSEAEIPEKEAHKKSEKSLSKEPGEPERESKLPKTAGAVQNIELKGLKNESIFPFQNSKAKATVFLFVCTDCPVACRYVPELNQIYEEYKKKGISFWLVYADEREPPETIEKHLKEYKHKISACTDYDQKLMNLSKATVTPEAAIFNNKGELVYRGRIDNRYHDYGETRAKPTKQELRDALTAILANKKIAKSITKPVGCFIPKKS